MSKYEEKAIRRVLETYNELSDAGKKKILDDIKYQGALAAAEAVESARIVLFGDLYPKILENQKYFNVFEGIATGLQYFDEAALGLRGGELIIVAGPSNHGKTMVALNMAVSAIVTEQKRVLVVSMEMPAQQIGDRAIHMTDDHDALMEGLGIQAKLRVSTEHIDVMLAQMRPDIMVVDHIQFLANQEQGSEYERITTATANLKALAMKYDIPVIAISHVAKTRSGADGQATAMDLKGSSSIEQDADVGFMINRLADSNQLQVTLFKHRTKRPPLFLLPCALTMNGVRIERSGAYSPVVGTNGRTPWGTRNT